MDWNKAKTALAQIAPWLAGTLGSPVAGVAVKALCDVFGLTGTRATPEDVTAALATATPEQLQAIRAAEDKHQEFMQQIGYTHLEQLAATTAQDRDSARKREGSLKDRTPAVLAAVAVIGFFVLVGMVADGLEPKDPMRDAFMLLLGASIALVKDVYGYYFGSSAGSQGKDATIASMAGDK